MGSPRVALASGTAAATGAALLLLGRADGSIITVAMLVIAARAAAASVAPGPHASRALGRQIALVPAWAAVLVVAAVRSGSVALADVRGANAVAGLAIAHGDAAIVAASWIAGIAALAAVAAAPDRGSSWAGMTAARYPGDRLDLAAGALQVLLVVTLFAGPQWRGIGSLAGWGLALAAAAAAVVLARARLSPDVLQRVAIAAATVSVLPALVGGSL